MSMMSSIAALRPAAPPTTPTVLSQTWCTPVAQDSYISPPFSSGAFDAVAGSLILVAVMQSRMNDRTINSVTDSAGNTYTKATFTQDNGDTEGQGLALWYCASSAAKTGNVVSCNNAGDWINITGIRVLQVSTPAGKSWSYDTGVGKNDSAAYESSVSAPAINGAGAGLLYSMAYGNQGVAASGCSLNLDDYLGAVCGTDAPTTSNGIDAIGFRTAAVSGQTVTADFGGNNEHPLIAVWSMTLS